MCFAPQAGVGLELYVKLGLLVYVCSDLMCPRRNVVLEADTLGGTRQLKAGEEMVWGSRAYVAFLCCDHMYMSWR